MSDPFLSLSLSLHRYVVVRLLFRISCNIFYPTIEVEGWENLPDEGEGTILCFNHNNGLGDPTVRRSRRGRTREIPTLAVCCARCFVCVVRCCYKRVHKRHSAASKIEYIHLARLGKERYTRRHHTHTQ